MILPGSPPHMRGKEQRRKRNENDMGITPAHAGKSSSVCVELSRSWDHPRTCGEKAWVGESKNNETGSPPHMRGKAYVVAITCNPDRITPAHAGKSCSALWASPNGWDHPRTCGEKSNLLITDVSYTGSPPHMRGKVCKNTLQSRTMGITPAHAGKSL